MSTRRSSNSAARPASPPAKSRPAGRDATPGRSGKAAGGRSVQRETRVPRPPREGDAPVESDASGTPRGAAADRAAARSGQKAGPASRDRRAPKGAATNAGKPTTDKAELPPRRIDKSARQRTLHAPVSAPPAEHVPRLLQAAFAERKAAQLPSSDTNCFRLVHDRWDELGGLVIEVWGPTAVIRIRNEIWLESSYRLAVRDALLNAGYESFHYIIDEDAKHSERQHAEREEGINRSLIEADLGAPTEPYLALENGMRLEINIRDGFSQGLYTDMRVVRADLRKRWKGRRVLNLFAYTCGFGVALAGDNEVTNVDVSAKYLEWGKRNYRHNGLSTDAGFIARDAFEYLEKAV
ncbi:MAG: class I SAM-dependent methyltransferase, partial [Myxococcales bacterium]|nr:class I SAM-dependent methyltransferase [Myxococcales bacterium]